MITINLLAPGRRRPRRVFSPAAGAVAASVVLIAILVVWSAALINRGAGLNRQLQETAREAAQLRPVAQQVEQMDRAAGVLQQRRAILQRLLTTQLPASESLAVIQSIIPRDVWLVSVSTLGTRQVTFNGYTFSYPSVAQFMVDLASSGSFRNVDLADTEKGKIADREVVRFQITGDLGTQHPVVSQREATP